MKGKPDWAAIRAHYESSEETLRQVGARFEVSERTIPRRRRILDHESDSILPVGFLEQ
jgi:hypothetical protein